MLKMIGVFFVFAGCGGFGWYLAYCCRLEENCLRQILRATEYMICELSYRQTDLPSLCRNTANLLSGPVKTFFIHLADELDAQVSPDAIRCAEASLIQVAIPKNAADILHQMGLSLGQFDLHGQITGLESVNASTQKSLQDLTSGKDLRIRNYQTLGLCAGAALVILFI